LLLAIFVSYIIYDYDYNADRDLLETWTINSVNKLKPEKEFHIFYFRRCWLTENERVGQTTNLWCCATDEEKSVQSDRLKWGIEQSQWLATCTLKVVLLLLLSIFHEMWIIVSKKWLFLKEIILIS
jgi:hypothetical protein